MRSTIRPVARGEGWTDWAADIKDERAWRGAGRRREQRE
jgi:hypothetical protein